MLHICKREIVKCPRNVWSQRTAAAICVVHPSGLEHCQQRLDCCLLLHFCTKSLLLFVALPDGVSSRRELQNNRIGGPIPSQIGQLAKLGKFNIMQNRLSGTVPTELGRLTAMVGLNLADNNLDGVIDGMLFARMSSLRYLALFDTLISGAIPSQLGLLTRLTSLFVSGNRFSGQIPSQLGQLGNLFEM